MESYHFKDLKPSPDKMFAYTDDIKDVPLILDNGSYTAKVGWTNQQDPAMIFKNLITKIRKDKMKKDMETQIGNDIVSVEAGRLNLRTQFDHGVVTHFEAQETLLDYSLTHLGVNTPDGLQHPMVISEPPANLNSSRAAMSELLFECYRVPSISYFVDALASLRYNQPDCRDALVISCGYHTTHVIPVLDGRMDAGNARRIGVGGFLMTSYLQRLLQLKNPSALAAITLSRAEELLHELVLFSGDYGSDLRLWADPAHQKEHTRPVQLPVTMATGSEQPRPSQPAAGEAKDKKLVAKARMHEMHMKKRQALISEDERRLARARQSGETDPEYLQELERRIEAGRTKLAELAERGQVTPVRLSPDALQARLEELEGRRRELLERRAERRRRRAEMARRRTAASQQRMRIISQLASQRPTKDDTFGARDEDWDVYKAINVDGGDSDSEADAEELTEVEGRLRQLAPDLAWCQPAAGGAQPHQIQLGTEPLQTAEILFQPSMLGLDQAGLAETIQFVLSKYPAESQQRLAGNVFVTGGVSNVPGLRQRLEHELRQMRPFQSSFAVSVASSPSLDAWRGARSLSAAGQLEYVSRQQYVECGADYLAEHMASNRYWPTPAEPAAGQPA
ncbi:actin-related protein 5-like [Amphibalanus amphitrite]|uniref:actin-related protein 5-like n=1 Tax=Amphibalanus amphitrite TaxID=1232801 RepID=UPI001C91D373|nr:actin-related protein 5-like [Amphibalanus amphitrite]